MNVEIGRQNIIILFWKKRAPAVSFLEIHKSEVILDFHRPFICSAQYIIHVLSQGKKPILLHVKRHYREIFLYRFFYSRVTN